MVNPPADAPNHPMIFNGNKLLGLPCVSSFVESASFDGLRLGGAKTTLGSGLPVSVQSQCHLRNARAHNPDPFEGVRVLCCSRTLDIAPSIHCQLPIKMNGAQK